MSVASQFIHVSVTSRGVVEEKKRKERRKPENFKISKIRAKFFPSLVFVLSQILRPVKKESPRLYFTQITPRETN
jgi:hypothetical protein